MNDLITKHYAIAYEANKEAYIKVAILHMVAQVALSHVPNLNGNYK